MAILLANRKDVEPMSKLEKEKFYLCDQCGNVIQAVSTTGVPVVCCGHEMTELTPNTSDGAQEKHLPVVTVQGDTVKVDVGSAPHPMEDAHSIEWVYLETDQGTQRKALTPGTAPVAVFHLGGARPKAVYAYCNLHGLWKTEL